MKISQIEDFKKEICDNLLRLEIEDISVVYKCIYKLVLECNAEELEAVLMDKLWIVVEEKRSDVVEAVCGYVGVKSGGDICGDMNGCSRGLMRVLRQEKKRELRWSDIAGGAAREKVDIPCGELLSRGVCMNADTCRFTHKHCAVVKPQVTQFSSLYNTSSERAPSRSFLLPGQSGYYDKMTMLPGASGARDDDVISVSSTEHGGGGDMFSPPQVFAPPTVFDSPLWYHEVGVLVPEDEDERHHGRRPPSDRDSSSSDLDRPCRHSRRRTLLVYNVPRALNKIGALNRYFRRFGAVRNIEVNLGKEGSRALVEFRLATDMRAADDCVDAVMGNRFIRTRPYKRARQHKAERRDRRRRRRRSSSSEAQSRSRSRESSSGVEEVKAEEEEREAAPEVKAEQEVQEEERAVAVKQECMEVVEQEPATNGHGQHLELLEHPRTARPAAAAAMEDDEDVKLERALHDSDVDSVTSEGPAVTRRQVIISSRRRVLRQDSTPKNSVQRRLARTAESMQYYKTTLESLIVEYRRNDKAGKARLIALIKEAHGKYMELKVLHEGLARRGADRGEVGRLGRGVAGLATAEDEGAGRELCLDVPPHIVLDPAQLQHHLGAEVSLEAVTKADGAPAGLCRYILRLQSPEAARTALGVLQGNNPMHWSIGMRPPASL